MSKTNGIDFRQLNRMAGRMSLKILDKEALLNCNTTFESSSGITFDMRNITASLLASIDDKELLENIIFRCINIKKRYDIINWVKQLNIDVSSNLRSRFKVLNKDKKLSLYITAFGVEKAWVYEYIRLLMDKDIDILNNVIFEICRLVVHECIYTQYRDAIISSKDTDYRVDELLDKYQLIDTKDDTSLEDKSGVIFYPFSSVAEDERVGYIKAISNRYLYEICLEWMLSNRLIKSNEYMKLKIDSKNSFWNNLFIADKYITEEYKTLMCNYGENPLGYLQICGVTLEYLKDINEDIINDTIKMELDLEGFLRYRGLSLLESALCSDSYKQFTREYEILKMDNPRLNNRLDRCKRDKTEALNKLKNANNRIKELERKLRESSKDTSSINRVSEEQLKIEVEQLEESLNTKKDKITRLQEIVNSLKSDLDYRQKEIDTLKRQLELEREMYSELELEYSEVTHKVQFDDSLPLEFLIDKLSNRKIVIVGGTSSISSSLNDLGITSVIHFEVEDKVDIKSVHGADCVVYITKALKHRAVYGCKQYAKNNNIPIVHFNGYNIKMLCREIYEAIK